jgi:hypothetical protein
MVNGYLCFPQFIWENSLYSFIILILSMYILLFIIILISLYTFYRYYYKPKAEIKRYIAIFQELGYKVYEMPFTFLGMSFYTD